MISINLSTSSFKKGEKVESVPDGVVVRYSKRVSGSFVNLRLSKKEDMSTVLDVASSISLTVFDSNVSTVELLSEKLAKAGFSERLQPDGTRVSSVTSEGKECMFLNFTKSVAVITAADL